MEFLYLPCREWVQPGKVIAALFMTRLIRAVSIAKKEGNIKESVTETGQTLHIITIKNL
jgi:hypothetical protein